MKLTKTIVVSFCCLGLAGCASMSSRQIRSAPAPAPVPTAGSELGAPPPPIAPPSGTISVAPERPKKMYNMEPTRKSTKKTTAAPKPKKAPVTDDMGAESAPIPVPEPKAKKEPPGPSAKAAECPVMTDADLDPAMIASPVRKSSGGSGRKTKPALDTSPDAAPAGPSTYKSGATPQSSLRTRGKTPIARRVEPEDALLPVSSNSVKDKKLDTKYSS